MRLIFMNFKVIHIPFSFVWLFIMLTISVLHFFMHMILMDSDNELAMNLGETYLVTENGNERLGKKKLDLVVG